MSCPTGKEEEVARCRRKDRKSVAEVQGNSQKKKKNGKWMSMIVKIFWCRGAG